MIIYLVQRDNFDGLYVFADEDQAHEYAELFPAADVSVARVIDKDRGAAMIAEELGDDDSQECENCGDTVYTLSSRLWCDGCEEEADLARPTT